MTQPPLPLPTNRAFVVQLRAQPPGAPMGWEGRVEHVVSGQMTHFHTLDELLAFICRVLAEVSAQRGQGVRRPDVCREISVVRDPQTGKLSKNFKEYGEYGDQIGRLRAVVPKMVFQVGGSIAFAPEPSAEAARWQAYDTRHMRAKIDPQPDQVKEKLSGGPHVAMAIGKPISRR